MCLYLLWQFLSKYIAHGLVFTVTLFCENQNLFVLLSLLPIEFLLPSKWPLSIFCWSPSNTHTSTCPEALRESGNPAVGLSRRAQCLPDCFTNEEWPHSGHHSVTHKWVWHDGVLFILPGWYNGTIWLSFSLLVAYSHSQVQYHAQWNDRQITHDLLGMKVWKYVFTVNEIKSERLWHSGHVWIVFKLGKRQSTYYERLLQFL